MTGGKKSIFADAAATRRCLVLSTGFFELRHVFRNHAKTGLPLKTPDKYPYYISVKDHKYFYMAGIWQSWTDQETGEIVETVAATTTVANPLMKQVLNSKERMPTILDDELAYKWMMDDLTLDEITEIEKMQYPANKMEACTVTKEFQALLEPTERFEYEGVPALDLCFAE